MEKIATKPARKKYVIKEKKLSLREMLFINEYAVSGNGAEAVRKAGFKSKCPKVYAVEILRKPRISKVVDQLRSDNMKRHSITADNVLREIALLAFQSTKNLYNPQTGKLIPIHELDDDVARTISSVKETVTTSKLGSLEKTTEMKTWDKKGSLELLGRNLKLFVDKFEVGGQDGKPLFNEIKVNFGKDDDETPGDKE